MSFLGRLLAIGCQRLWKAVHRKRLIVSPSSCCGSTMSRFRYQSKLNTVSRTNFVSCRPHPADPPSFASLAVDLRTVPGKESFHLLRCGNVKNERRCFLP